MVCLHSNIDSEARVNFTVPTGLCPDQVAISGADFHESEAARPPTSDPVPTDNRVISRVSLAGISSSCGKASCAHYPSSSEFPRDLEGGTVSGLDA